MFLSNEYLESCSIRELEKRFEMISVKKPNGITVTLIITILSGLLIHLNTVYSSNFNAMNNLILAFLNNSISAVKLNSEMVSMRKDYISSAIEVIGVMTFSIFIWIIYIGAFSFFKNRTCRRIMNILHVKYLIDDKSKKAQEP